MIPADSQKSDARGNPVRWVLLGVLVTLGIVLALRFVSPTPASPTLAPANAPASSSALEPLATAERSADSAREEFARLYLDYLLKTYYVYERGFCSALLVAICNALVKTRLLESAAACRQVPNTELVLAIARYQHDTGLPVDGKAGPETVRRMLGGGFSSRRAMAEKYCPAWRPPPAPSSRVPAPDTTVAW